MDDVPPTRLNINESVAMATSPTAVVPLPVAVHTATHFTVTFQARLLPSGMIKLVVPVPSNESTVVAADAKVSDFLATSVDC